MHVFKFNDDQISTLTNALYVAIERFNYNVSVIEECDLTQEARSRLKECFERQIERSRDVLNIIEA